VTGHNSAGKAVVKTERADHRSSADRRGYLRLRDLVSFLPKTVDCT
jgi:hypothetical protein